MPELRWRATYGDGTVLTQEQPLPDGRAASADDIDRRRVVMMELVNARGAALYTLHLDPAQRLIYRRRGEVVPGAGLRRMCHLLGWQMTVRHENVQSIAYVFEDGEVHLAGRFREDHPWFYSPKLRPFEQGE